MRRDESDTLLPSTRGLRCFIIKDLGMQGKDFNDDDSGTG